jgi:hypothetical protein
MRPLRPLEKVVSANEPTNTAPFGVESPVKEPMRPLRLLEKVVSANEPTNTAPFVVLKAIVLVVEPHAVLLAR